MLVGKMKLAKVSHFKIHPATSRHSVTFHGHNMFLQDLAGIHCCMGHDVMGIWENDVDPHQEDGGDGKVFIAYVQGFKEGLLGTLKITTFVSYLVQVELLNWSIELQQWGTANGKSFEGYLSTTAEDDWSNRFVNLEDMSTSYWITNTTKIRADLPC